MITAESCSRLTDHWAARQNMWRWLACSCVHRSTCNDGRAVDKDPGMWGPCADETECQFFTSDLPSSSISNFHRSYRIPVEG